MKLAIGEKRKTIETTTIATEMAEIKIAIAKTSKMAITLNKMKKIR